MSQRDTSGSDPDVSRWDMAQMASRAWRTLVARLHDARAEDVAREQEAALHELLVAFEPPVLVLDRDHAVIPDGIQGGEEARPVDLAEARKPRHLPPDAAAERPVPVEAVSTDLEILRMDVKDPVGEVVDRPLVVDHQPHEGRPVEVEPEMPRGQPLEHLLPDRRPTRDTVASGTLVTAKAHRTVLERYL